MDGQTIATWAAAGAAFVAAAASTWQAHRARKSADTADARANEARESAAAALARAADAQQELASAVTEYRVPWSVVTERNGWYEITNAGAEDAFRVTVATDDGLAVHDGDEREIVHGWSAIRVLIRRESATDPHGRRIVVTWHRPGESAQRRWSTERYR